MACTTENRFDHLSKIMASSVSRRDVFRYAGVTALAMALSTVGLKKAAEAGGHCPKDCPACDLQAACEVHGCTECGCIPTIRGGELTGKCFCHEFVFCDDLVPCDSNKDCKQAGLRGWRCAQSCCDPVDPFAGFCHPRCGTGFGACGTPPVAGRTGRTSRG